MSFFCLPFCLRSFFICSCMDTRSLLFSSFMLCGIEIDTLFSYETLWKKAYTRGGKSGADVLVRFYMVSKAIRRTIKVNAGWTARLFSPVHGFLRGYEKNISGGQEYLQFSTQSPLYEFHIIKMINRQTAYCPVEDLGHCNSFLNHQTSHNIFLIVVL